VGDGAEREDSSVKLALHNPAGRRLGVDCSAALAGHQHRPRCGGVTSGHGDLNRGVPVFRRNEQEPGETIWERFVSR
jgi:hypothetical protein